jgi:hypothetical protein
MQETQAILDEHLFSGAIIPTGSAGKSTSFVEPLPGQAEQRSASGTDSLHDPTAEVSPTDAAKIDTTDSGLDDFDGANGGMWLGSDAEYIAKYGTLKLESPSFVRIGAETAEDMRERIEQTYARNKAKKIAYLASKKTGDPCQRTTIGYFSIPEHQSKFPNWEHNEEPTQRFPPSAKLAPPEVVADMTKKILEKQNRYQDSAYWTQQYILEGNRDRFVFFPKGCKDDIIQKVFPVEVFGGKRKVDTNKRETEDWKVHRQRIASESKDVGERKKFAAWRLYLKDRFKTFASIPETFDWCQWQKDKFEEVQQIQKEKDMKTMAQIALEKYGPLVPPPPPAKKMRLEVDGA